MTPRIRREPGGLNEHTVESVPLSALHPLAHRQAQVTGWIAFGKRNSEIAKILDLSERTVEKHVQKIFQKLGVETRGAAGRWWHERVIAYLLARAGNGQ